MCTLTVHVFSTKFLYWENSLRIEKIQNDCNLRNLNNKIAGSRPMKLYAGNVSKVYLYNRIMPTKDVVIWFGENIHGTYTFNRTVFKAPNRKND